MSSGQKLLKQIQHSHVDPLVLRREFNFKKKKYRFQEAGSNPVLKLMERNIELFPNSVILSDVV